LEHFLEFGNIIGVTKPDLKSFPFSFIILPLTFGVCVSDWVSVHVFVCECVCVCAHVCKSKCVFVVFVANKLGVSKNFEFRQNFEKIKICFTVDWGNIEMLKITEFELDIEKDYFKHIFQLFCLICQN